MSPNPQGNLREHRNVREHGGALISLVLWLAVVGVALLLLMGVSQRTVTRSRAQAAADAAALAGAIDGRSGAERFAEANGAELLSFDAVGNLVVVKVQISGTTAEARASLNVFGHGVTARPHDYP